MDAVTVKEAARRLDRDPETIRRAIRDGFIKALQLRPGSPYLIPEKELQRLEGA